MIPILSSIIVGQDQHPTRMHAFYLSLAYTLGMAVTYTLAGIAAAFSGQLISSALQNPWALGGGQRSSYCWRCLCSAYTNCACQAGWKPAWLA